MSFDTEQVSWLQRARAQSLRLAEARARQPRVWQPSLRQVPERRPMQWALAGALAILLLGGGAWAVVSRTQTIAPPPPPPSQPAVIDTVPHAVAPHPQAPPMKKIRRKQKKIAQPRPFEEGDGELILVAPHKPPPPLFSPDEFKQQRRQP